MKEGIINIFVIKREVSKEQKEAMIRNSLNT